MSKKNFLVSAAKAAFALAAVVMMSAVFTSCSKDDDDDDAKKFTNTVTFGGMEKPIVKAEYEDRGSGNYKLFFYLVEEGSAERVEFQLNKGLHMNGTPVKLTEKEEKHSGLYWGVAYYTPDGEQFFNTFAGPSSPIPVFSDGTFTVNGDPVTGIRIKLENGLVIGKDDNEHTITMSYSGKMTEKKKKKKK
ncbi:hypothetical protein [Segatella oulorum]|uniref:hypothetical protein n=1 Tax=Segatella oulorum TaxID=28136 RepID=UPI0023F28DA5|nr:hypothetical protein [Segatella oulorum]